MVGERAGTRNMGIGHSFYAPSYRNKQLAWSGYGFGHTSPRHPSDLRGTVIGRKGRFRGLWTTEGGV